MNKKLNYFIFQLNDKNHSLFLNKMNYLKLLNLEIFYLYLNNNKIRKFILNDFNIFDSFLTNKNNFNINKLLLFFYKKKIINDTFFKNYLNFKLNNSYNKMIKFQLFFFSNIDIDNYKYFYFYSFFSKKQIENFLVSKNYKNIKSKILKIINNKEKDNIEILFLFKYLLLQNKYFLLEENFKKEILEYYLKILNYLIYLFLNTNIISYEIITDYINIFYNIPEKFIDEIEETIIPSIQKKISNTKLINYNIYYKIENFLKFFKFYNKYVIENEDLIEFIKNNPDFIYYIDFNYISFEIIIELIDELIFINNNNENDDLINKLLILIVNFDIKTLYINKPKEYKKIINNFFNDILFELIYSFEENFPPLYKYSFIKILEKFEFDIENIESEDKKLLIDLIFKFFKKENFYNMSYYYMNYIYIYYKNKYKNKEKFEEEFFNLIKKYNLFFVFLKSKYLFKEKKLFYKLLSYYKDKLYMFFSKMSEEYLKNPYFDTKKQHKLFNKLSKEEKKLFLKNNKNLNLFFIQTIKNNDENFYYLINNKEFLYSLIFEND